MPIFGRCKQSWITSKSLVTGRAGLPNRPACAARSLGRLASESKCLAQSNKSRDGGRGDYEVVHKAQKQGSNPMENILRCIAREANRSGDAKTLFHALDLLEHLIPIATGRVDAFMTFCAELETEGDGWKARRPRWSSCCRSSDRDVAICARVACGEI